MAGPQVRHAQQVGKQNGWKVGLLLAGSPKVTNGTGPLGSCHTLAAGSSGAFTTVEVVGSPFPRMTLRVANYFK